MRGARERRRLKRKELIEVKNQADSLIYTTEKTISELGEVSEDQKTKAEDAVKAQRCD
ncbi:MAG: hypothetical protein SRB1_01823 [Desulfobacteraceae bacterium Eth-SRB1]|nr:MAG: hypothetical protein SRB1_01823 [Desulfobacteraceae bacterium Eth-SRB1]